MILDFGDLTLLVTGEILTDGVIKGFLAIFASLTSNNL
jgi:hypothetical protein